MVFKNISLIKSKKDKNVFLEKIQLHIRIVQCIAEIEKIDFTLIDDGLSNEALKKIIDIGIINEFSEILLLEKTLGLLYKDFVKSVNFSNLYKHLIGNNLDKLNNSIRLNYQKNEYKSKKPTIVDFFCGAGGLSLGFVKSGYRVVLANDHEDVCIDTYSYNHPEVRNESILNDDIKIIVDNINDYLDQEVDVVAGGPPCQGFSSANQQRIIDDPRNELYKYFLKAVEKLAPKFVVMENVRGMMPFANQIVEDYKNISSSKGSNKFSYEVSYRILISDDYGVAQRRQRLIFIAVRNDIIKKKKITPDEIFDNIQNIKGPLKRYNLSDALDFIKKLDANRIKNTNEIDSNVSGKKVDVNIYNGDENDYLRMINDSKKIPIIFNHKSRFVSDINYEIYRILEQGEDATNEKIKHLMPYAHRNNIFKDKYYKLIANKPSRTITAHLRMDCHSHIHPFQIRSITPREAARIQSFPDDYVFLGAYLKTYMQIGNAVPPLMAYAIANQIKKYL